jgi:hypothetical protein
VRGASKTLGGGGGGGGGGTNMRCQKSRKKTAEVYGEIMCSKVLPVSPTWPDSASGARDVIGPGPLACGQQQALSGKRGTFVYMESATSLMAAPEREVSAQQRGICGGCERSSMDD